MANTQVTYTHDVIVIGAGPGGYALALDCGRRGLKTAIVEERETLGGTCLNVGCIPSKALLESSKFFYRLNHEAGVHGVKLADGGAVLDLKAMMARKSSIVDKLTGGIAVLMKARKVEVIHGLGIVAAPGHVTVETSEARPGGNTAPRELTAPRIVLATGSIPAGLTHLPFDGKKIIDSTDALSLTKVPKSLAVIGAGAVGLELGSIWSRLGSKVIIIEAMNQIIPGTDAQAARILAGALKKQGIVIHTGAMVESAELSSRKITISIRTRSKSGTGNTALAGNPADGSSPANSSAGLETIDIEKILVAVGRQANLDTALGAGIDPERTADGRFIKVDSDFSTSIDGLFAIGDLIGNPMLAHKAEDEALALAALFAGEAHPPWGGPIPGIVYTEPELAWAGETEDGLKASGSPYEKGHFPFAANARALAAEAGDGFVKLLSSPGDGKLLGAVIVGHGASELIAEAISVMAMGGSAEDIALTVHGHPTLSEITKEAALTLIGRPLHRT